jgi:hypothetical protein
MPGMPALAIRTRRAGALVALALTAGACGQPPELEKQLETLSSWTATMQLAREEHGSGAITTTYGTQLRDAATSALEDTKQTIGQAAHSRVDSSYAGAALDSLRAAIRMFNAEMGS